jgi:sodium/hydrogen antiporter
MATPEVSLIGIFGVFALLLFIYGLFSRRLQRSVITAQMIFVVAGLLLAPAALLLLPGSDGANSALFIEAFTVIGEIALVFTLFVDASRIDLRALRQQAALPSRLLGIGLILTIILGAVVALLLFPGLALVEAALLGTILAPTDAALGAVVVNNLKIPVRIRQTLNVESGLNDGIAVPFFLIFLELTLGEELHRPLGEFLAVALEQIGIGVIVGLVVGLLGAWCIHKATEREWATETFSWISLVALALLAWALAHLFGGSPFIAAFVGGLATAAVGRGLGEKVVEFTEAEGEILNYLVFFLVGIFAFSLLVGIGWQVVLYAVLSLTVIRMLPVALSLIGSRLSGTTVLFVGWFGPRGLASIVLVLIAMADGAAGSSFNTIRQVVILTVLLSVFAHGISANPLSDRYARYAATLKAERPENEPAPEMPTRSGVPETGDLQETDAGGGP